MNAHWSDDSIDAARDFPLLRGAEITLPDVVDRRGPKYPFFVGRGNRKAAFTHQNEAYKAVAAVLASWMTSRQVQGAMLESVLGNWHKKSKVSDNARLISDSNYGAPAASLGYSSLSLGRDRFQS